MNALERRYPKLKGLSRVSLVDAPTLVEPLTFPDPPLSGLKLWVKRDDLTNPLYGGNKPRKYEYVFADLQRRKFRHIFTVGGLGSNHALACTVLGAHQGFKTSLFLVDQPLSQAVRQTLLCDRHYGAELHYTKTPLRTAASILAHLATTPRAYYLCAGASTPLGAIGFVNAAFELAEQIRQGEIPEPDRIFVAVGSSGMAAGLALGLTLAQLKTKITGVAVSEEKYNSKHVIQRLAVKANRILRRQAPEIPKVASQIFDRLAIDRSFFGGRYGRWTPEGLAALKLIEAHAVGYHLDPVYTAKTFAALLHYYQTSPGAKEEDLLYWHSKASTDLSQLAAQVSFRELPPKFHPLFSGRVSLQEDHVESWEGGR